MNTYTKEEPFIRKAKEEDIERIAYIEGVCFPVEEAAKLPAITQRVKTFGDRFWLLEMEGEVVAFINGILTDEPELSDEMYEKSSMHNKDGAWQMIFGVDTLPEYQHKGLASLVMQRVIEDCRKEGRKGIVLTCKDRLKPFYERFGYECEGVSDSEHGGAVWYSMRMTF